ncbi:MAG: hypothetical protein F7C32_00355 [Desulfurococcales archaeon]|nr:hypothetical protein [Desulfurococcales archaeon]
MSRRSNIMASSRESFLSMVHVVKYRPESKCPYFQMWKVEDGYVAHCKILERNLTRHEVQLCEEHWESCPIKRYGDLILEGLED